MPLLIIQPNNTTSEARTWLTNLWRELTELLDPKGRLYLDPLYLSAKEVDTLFTYAISTLLEGGQ